MQLELQNVLVFVGLISLPAVHYAITVERFTAMSSAQTRKVGFLAVWRVALLFHYLVKLAGLPGYAVVVAALLPRTIIVSLLTLFNLEHLVFDLMAGLRDSDV